MRKVERFIFSPTITALEMPYERVYDVGLLDDLHNYFPQLLYRSERFGTVQDVLRYIQEATHRRFNLFDYGRRQYEDTIPRNTHIRAQPPVRVEHAQRAWQWPQANAGWPQQQPQANAAVEADFIPILQTFINMPPRIGRTNGINSIFQDVVIHASQEIIDRASVASTLDQDLDDNCPICQDSMRQGELIRKLNVCNHQFHKACVDNWFLNDSVLCPTCRHDIRQPTRLPSPMLTAAAPNPTDENQVPESPLEPDGPPGLVTPPRQVTMSSRTTLRARTTEAQDLLNALFGLS